mgnify:CR=1 FL=1
MLPRRVLVHRGRYACAMQTLKHPLDAFCDHTAALLLVTNPLYKNINPLWRVWRATGFELHAYASALELHARVVDFELRARAIDFELRARAVDFELRSCANALKLRACAVVLKLRPLAWPGAVAVRRHAAGRPTVYRAAATVGRFHEYENTHMAHTDYRSFVQRRTASRGGAFADTDLEPYASCKANTVS